MTHTTNGINWSGYEAECLHCGAVKEFNQAKVDMGDAEVDTVPCQGSDECTARLCPACEKRCPNCGLPTCEEHLKQLGPDDWQCSCCRKERARIEREETIGALEAAGCTPEEVAAWFAAEARIERTRLSEMERREEDRRADYEENETAAERIAALCPTRE